MRLLPVRPRMPPNRNADTSVRSERRRCVYTAWIYSLRHVLAADLTTLGCYEAGKLYLHNRRLRDYARAQQRLTGVCDGDDADQGPYACKYLGWMHLTGTGTSRDLDQARVMLARACFLQNDALMIDPEGCHFRARAVLETRARSPRHDAMADYVVFISLAQACTDGAKTVCDQARSLYQRGSARGAAWIKRCDQDIDRHDASKSCAELATIEEHHDAANATRRQLRSLFRQATIDPD